MRINQARWQRARRRLRRSFERHALILMYHRIVELPSDPQLLCVTPRHFAEQLEVIRNHAHPLKLAQLAERLRAGKLPNRAVIVTFDDGYADNLYNAKPLLERYEVPATVFVTAGHVGREREFWWDELDRLLLQPGVLPTQLRLQAGGRTWEWELGNAALYTEADYRCYHSWHIEREIDPSPRQSLYRSLYQLLFALPEGERRQVLDQFVAWAGAEATGRPTHRTLTSDEVIQLDEGELIEVGAHTMTHPVLGALSTAAQRDEIRRSKIELQELLGHPLISFAYPHGSMSWETVAIVREAGFMCAGTSHPDVVWPDADCFQLARVVVRDWDGERFARWLRGWIGG